MTILKEISLSNGQTLKNVGFAGSKDEFDTARKTAFEIELERQSAMATTDVIHLLTDTIVYYVFSSG